MTKKNKKVGLSNNLQHILCKLDECIPKGIILYYPLVSILNRDFSDKKVFDNFLFFSFLKKTDYLYIRFFGCPGWLDVPTPQSEELQPSFWGQPVGRAGLQHHLKNHNYCQIKLFHSENQKSENSMSKYCRQKPP
jgi:hypothetical protein